MSGVSRWGSDIGGYDTLGDDPQLTPELLKRWIEFGAVSGVMRTKAIGHRAARPTRGRRCSTRTIVQVWRRYAKLHTQLLPVPARRRRRVPRDRHAAHARARAAHPSPTRARDRRRRVRLRADLLAAPVVEQGQTSRVGPAAARALARPGSALPRVGRRLGGAPGQRRCAAAARVARARRRRRAAAVRALGRAPAAPDARRRLAVRPHPVLHAAAAGVPARALGGRGSSTPSACARA